MQNEEQVLKYIENLIPDRSEAFLGIEKYAEENEVPIMELVGIETLLQLLRMQQPKKILEIGTAIGYSALRMADALPECKIVSIERDEDRYNVALSNVETLNKSSQVHFIKGDALEVENLVQEHGPFDALFIDAAKSQYRKFFDIYSKMLSPEGVIFTDNILFHGLVVEENIDSRNVRQLVRKIKDFNQWLMQHPDYHTAILPVGDGLAISKKRR
ncbi:MULTISPECIES: O-methyltransferase [Bacillaceae]|uniref:O-methyltransferase n=1 Tax=Niallia TaxID=2837506 RepID=UPI001E5C2C66|nr:MULTISPECIES: O-methyltransferase [Bacillaceae]MCE4046945.1 O-methyltransferase [Bacillus sp. Au-Bac7]MCM3030048.1 O-methyltransferase [Niallia sp. MER 6]MDL0437583.1 O-methyltransferase [Niallia sp. SS-2023]UPO86667.1 O-methyltransferase [Niallia sp. Man26]